MTNLDRRVTELASPARTSAPREIRALAMTGMGGIPEASLRAGMARNPHFLGCDMGSIDSGAFSLGSGKPAGATERDIGLMLEAQQTLSVPLLAGSAGMAGGEPHLAFASDVFQRVARERGYRFKMALIHAEISKATIHAALDAGRVRPLGPVPTLTHDQIDEAVRIVGQMGPEPYMAALEMGAEVVLAGRSCDTSQYVAVPLMNDYDPGLAFHMAKIIECVSLCAEPGGRDCILGTLRDDHFILDSQNPNRRCTPISVAAHSLYEQPNPYYMYEPGGMLDTTTSRYQAVDERVTRVEGSRWVSAAQYTVKLEGARLGGYRTIAMAGIRAPDVIANIDSIERDVRAGIEAEYGPNGADYRLKFTKYGRDGVLGPLETSHPTPHEIFLLIDVVAGAQDQARAVCQQAKQNFAHGGFPGRLSTAGNLAFPFSPNVLDVGPFYEFNVYHLIEVDDPEALFPIDMIEV
jgi:hypothetical protein